MDLALAFVPLSPHPLGDREAQYTLPGLASPIHLLPTWVDPDTGRTWTLNDPASPIGERVRAALALDRLELAWELADHRAMADPAVALALELWAARHLATAGLEQHADRILVLGAEHHARRLIAQRGLSTLGELGTQFALPLWPPWAGPVVVVADDRAVLGLDAGEHRLHRPALPVIRLPAGVSARELREVLAERLCTLALDRLAGRHPWPEWFRAGMIGVAEARARGEGPSPRRMAEIRRAAGVAGLRRLFALDAVDDPELATAVVAYACHRRRAGRLIVLMDLLRNDVDALNAFDIAYGVTPADLLEE